ncbi:C-GCAxxG-C-C family protein [Clostridium botulinum]|uniref:C-GCAxxG-C-C family (seleno)protein n=1 Tax=Clostridium botulinum TaxID=1491 RepID=UPI0017489E9C|nr:C-GCAxxG-C-C family (seleno)protein [Clostridium botulinum]MBD5643850.1 C-GCAxxG-C-C family protein [Clostridium botulinum]
MNNIDFDKIRKVAEDYYRNGDFYCSEAVVKTIRDEFKIEVSDDAIAMASGFPVGMGGSGCTCGAIAGGIMALGMVFGRKPIVAKSMELSKKLHDDFKKEHKSLCCRFLTKDMELGSKEHMDQCIAFTGEVAERVARIIVENR